MPVGSVVGDYVAPPGDAHQELMEGAMGMFPANVLAGYIEYQKIALYLERYLSMDFAEGQAAAHIFGARQTVHRSLA